MASVRGETVPAGRARSSGELVALLNTCEVTPLDIRDANARNAGTLSLRYGCGLRRAELVTAGQRRLRPAPSIIHSDRGSWYTRHQFQQLLASHDVLASISGTGNGYDNAMVESFLATLKQEQTHHVTYRTRAEATISILSYNEAFTP